MDSLPGIPRGKPTPIRRRTRVWFLCGTREDRERPSGKHFEWHFRGSGKHLPMCGKALAEWQWKQAESRAGHVLPDWCPYEAPEYDCGSEEEAEGPSVAHYRWHRNKRTAQCPKSLKERSWYDYEWNRDGQPCPDYEYGGSINWEIDTFLYLYRFADGDIYWGITAQRPDVRWRKEEDEDSLLGEKLQLGMMVTKEVVCRFSNRRFAMLAEKGAILAGNPFGSMLNVVHNPWHGQPAPHWGPVNV